MQQNDERIDIFCTGDKRTTHVSPFESSLLCYILPLILFKATTCCCPLEAKIEEKVHEEALESPYICAKPQDDQPPMLELDKQNSRLSNTETKFRENIDSLLQSDSEGDKEIFERADLDDEEEEVKEKKNSSFTTGVKGCSSLTSTMSTSFDQSLNRMNEKGAPTFTPSTFHPHFKPPEMVIPRNHGGMATNSDVDTFSNYSGSLQSSFRESGYAPFGDDMGNNDRKHSYHSDMNYGHFMMDQQADRLQFLLAHQNQAFEEFLGNTRKKSHSLINTGYGNRHWSGFRGQHST